MNITAELKKLLTEKFGLKADATDDEVRKAVTENLTSGKLSLEQLNATQGVKAPTTDELIAKAVADGVEKHLREKGIGQPAPRPAEEGMAEFLYKNHSRIGQNPDAVRVKSVAERYDGSTKQALYPKNTTVGGHMASHPYAGEPAMWEGEPLMETSKRSIQIAGAWLKMMMNAEMKSANKFNRVPPQWQVTEHDKDLVNYAVENSCWDGFVDHHVGDEGLDARDPRTVAKAPLTDMQKLWMKALLDDTTSGGIEIAPIEFDNAIVQIPVLYGQLYPFVNVQTVTRGRRMKGGSVINPTYTWGVAEGTNIVPFNTQTFIAAFDTTIYNAVGAMTIGLDFLEDSPTNIADIIVKKYGDKAMETLDFVIANGDGATQPLGIFNTSSPVVVSTDGQTAGPPTVSDYEALLFGVQKKFREEPGARPAFIGNDVSYQRSRSIPVSPTDERRVFGMDHQSYTLLATPYKIQADIVNSKIAFAMLNRYRMYRRLGLTVRLETQGQTLALANERLIVVRMRYGGQVELGGAVAVTTNAQA